MRFARRGVRVEMESKSSARRPSRACRPSLDAGRCEDRVMLSVAVVSAGADGTGPGNSSSAFGDPTQPYAQPNGVSSGPQGHLSADGSKLVFASEATNLVAGLADTNHASDVIVRNTATGQDTLVSATPAGQPGNGASFDPAISPDGRYVAFVSQATDLSTVAPPQTALQDPTSGYLYLRDLQTGTTTLLDQTPGGKASDGLSTGQFVFSPDSHYLAFIDSSDNLTGAAVEPAPPSAMSWPSMSSSYVYVRDLGAQSTSLVSVSTDGRASGGMPGMLGNQPDLTFSPDSRSLVFDSTATDLTSNPVDHSAADGAGAPYGPVETNLFLRDLQAGTTTLLSATTGGQLSAGDSMGAVFSPDGRSVAFTSTANDLTANGVGPGDSSPGMKLFVRDLSTGTTRLITATATGHVSTETASSPTFSPDGRSLAFVSSATDLTAAPVDPGGSPSSSGAPGQGSYLSMIDNIFLADLATGAITPVTVASNGQLSNGEASSPIFSPDGRYLAFTSSARDLTANAPEASTPPMPGTPWGGSASYGFSSPSGPTAGAPMDNVYVRDLQAGTTSLASPTSGGLLPVATSGGLFFSPDSRLLFFASGALDLTNNPPETRSSGPPLPYSVTPNNVFARNLSAGTTTLLSATADGHLSAASTTSAFLSPDGQTIYFSSDAPNLVAGAPGHSTNIYAATASSSAALDQFQFRSWWNTALESSGQAVVDVIRTGPATGAASVDYSVQDGAAKAGVDYQATSGTLEFAPGETSRSFTVPLIAGDQFPGRRNAQLVLSNPQGEGLGLATATLGLLGGLPNPSPPGTVPTVPIWAAASAPSNTTGTPAVTTPTSATASTTPAAQSMKTVDPGPSASGVVQTTRGHHGTINLVITFNRPLDAASAQDAANYRVSLAAAPRHGHGHTAARQPGRALKVTAVHYDASTSQVTLTVRSGSGRHRPAFVQIKGSAGGVVGRDGAPLNSPGSSQAGRDSLIPV